jgi:hypothetical protein
LDDFFGGRLRFTHRQGIWSFHANSGYGTRGFIYRIICRCSIVGYRDIVLGVRRFNVALRARRGTSSYPIIGWGWFIIRAKQGCRAVPSIGHAAEFFVLRAM